MDKIIVEGHRDQRLLICLKILNKINKKFMKNIVK